MRPNHLEKDSSWFVGACVAVRMMYTIRKFATLADACVRCLRRNMGALGWFWRSSIYQICICVSGVLAQSSLHHLRFASNK